MLMGPQPHHQLLGRYATASTVTSGYPLQPRFAPLQVQPPPLQITSKCPPLDPVTVPPNASCQPAFSTFMSRVSTPSAPHQQNQHSNTASANLIAAAVAAAAASNTTSSPPVVAVRDSQWLKLTVCQPYLRELMAGGQVAAIPTAERCPLTADTCPLAHPQPHVRIENDHVTVCYDFMKVGFCLWDCITCLAQNSADIPTINWTQGWGWVVVAQKDNVRWPCDRSEIEPWSTHPTLRASNAMREIPDQVIRWNRPYS